MLRRRGLIAVIIAVLGIAAAPTLSYSAAAGTAATRETKAQKLARQLKACRRDKSKSKRRACEKHLTKCYGCQRPSTHAREEQVRRLRESREAREREEHRQQEREAREREEASSATLIIHVYSEGYEPPGKPGTCAERLLARAAKVPREELECHGETLWERFPEESEPVRITRLENPPRLGPDGELLIPSLVTSERTVHVAPGRYELVADVTAAETVTVSEGQTVEVRLIIYDKG